MPKPAEIRIRTMEIDDVAGVYHLGGRIFTSEYANLYRTWDEYEVTGLFLSDGELCFVADADDRLAGFALGTVIRKPRSAWSYGHLLWLGVDPDLHRAGIASRLFDAYRARIEEDNVRMMLIDTQADNEPALRFFERKGFANPTDHVYLTLNLETTDEE